jgi:hypothetical protein
MIKNKPYLIFLIGLILILSVSAIFYITIPSFDFPSGDYQVYKPENSLPELVKIGYSASNKYLLIQFTKYGIEYMALFVALYFLLSRSKRFEFNSMYVWLHFGLVILGFSALIYLNQYIVNPKSQSGYLVDIFIRGELTDAQKLDFNQSMLKYSSLKTYTSLLGITLCVLGALVFIIGLFRGWNNSSKQIS